VGQKTEDLFCEVGPCQARHGNLQEDFICVIVGHNLGWELFRGQSSGWRKMVLLGQDELNAKLF
jgi:hypothetical protein